MKIEKEEGTPYYKATQNGRTYLGYSHYEAMSRALEDIKNHPIHDSEKSNQGEGREDVISSGIDPRATAVGETTDAS